MDAKEAAQATRDLLARYDPGDLPAMTGALRDVWLQGTPATARESWQRLVRDADIDDPNYGAVGTPVPVLTAVGKEIGKRARKRVHLCLPLARLLWEAHGREGRIVAVVALGPMELADPEAVVPVLHELAQTCVSWEDCDQLAMKALEPILRQDPENWLERMGSWVLDENKWVRRAGMTALGRLPMVQADYAARCVQLVAPALGDPDTDVKRALSFALRLCARGDVEPVRRFILESQDLTGADSLWVLCDVIRSMWKALLPRFVDLLPLYHAWLDTAEPKARRSVEGAIRVLQRAQPKTSDVA
jgi:3-methyladenine DNA glycosylase AlkD